MSIKGYQPYLITEEGLGNITSEIFKISDEALKFALSKGYKKEQIYIYTIFNWDKAEIECRECGLHSKDNSLINQCDTDERGNYICPECGAMAIVTNLGEREGDCFSCGQSMIIADETKEGFTILYCALHQKEVKDEDFCEDYN